jgi:hypothetical protein
LESYGTGGPEEAAAFIAQTVADLSKIAQQHGLSTLKHLLDMALLEASELFRDRGTLS